MALTYQLLSCLKTCLLYGQLMALTQRMPLEADSPLHVEDIN